MNRKVVVAAVIGVGAFLAVGHAEPASAGILDIMQNSLSGATGPIQANAARWSSTLFYTFVGAEFLYLLYRGMFMHDFSQILDAWVQRLVFYGFGVLVLQNQVALSQSLLAWIGGIASDFVVAGGGVPLTPDGLMSIGWNLSLAVCNVETGGILTQAALVIPQQLAALALTFAFLVIAIEDLVVQVGCQVCVALAGIAIGLMATRWTRPFAAVFPRVLFSTLILTVTINAVAAIGVLIGNSMMALTAQANGQSGAGLLNDFVTITAAGTAYAFFSLAIPTLVGFLGATSPIPGYSAVTTMIASAASYAAGRSSSGSGGGNSTGGRAPIAQLEAATKLS